MKNQTGFIQIPLLIGIIVSIVAVSVVTTGVVLYKQGKLASLTATISGVFEGKTVEMEELKPAKNETVPEVEKLQKKLEPQSEFQSKEEPQAKSKQEGLQLETKPESKPQPQLKLQPQEELKTDPCSNAICSACQYCLNGNCVARPDGYNDCGSGCQKCIRGSCQDYNGACPNCQYCSSDACVNYCQRIDISCGCTNCVNCNASDRCSGDSYLDYYCSGASCTYTTDNCSDCSCSCGSYNVTESIADGNCNDRKDNDCDGAIDSIDSECTQVSATVLITYVIDGDTAKISTGESIRLIGINTPERGQPYYEEATNRLKTLVEGKSVRLEKDIDDQDQWGRLLRFIFYNDENINVKMIREGYATVYIIPPNTKHKAELENAWQECLSDKINLCKPGEDICDNTCIGIDYFHWNAEGDDCYNLNDEYVTFRNSCSYSCDLTDWTVKDESSRSPHSFSTFTLKSGATVILYTGCGTNTETELYWCSSGYSCNAIWNNSCSGDTLYLRNRRGELILDYHYTGFCE